MPHPSGSGVPPDQGAILNRRQPSTTPLAAAGVSFGPSSKARWKVYHIRIKLVTSGTAGSRLILVYMTDGTTAPVSGTEGTNVIYEWVNSGTYGTGRAVAATTTEVYEITLLVAADAIATLFKLIAHPFPVGGLMGLFIQDTAAIDAAGDRVTIETLVEEWIEP